MELLILEGLKAIVDTKLQDAIEHMDIYKRQYEESDDENKLPWDRPALFFEIMPYTTEPHAGKLQKATVTIRLHLVTENKSDTRLNSEDWQAGLKHLNLKNQVFAAFEGMAYNKELSLVGTVQPINDAGEFRIFNSLTRRAVDSFALTKKLNVCIQSFSTVAFDHSAIQTLTKPDPAPGFNVSGSI